MSKSRSSSNSWHPPAILKQHSHDHHKAPEGKSGGGVGGVGVGGVGGEGGEMLNCTNGIISPSKKISHPKAILTYVYECQ